ncbi:hypothetical protein [Burkholderia vietnamiensis]|uniref:hypothetical protein n=1 Tax=Burkholderia vietnamiensis TaxID=60552 RepID=UPI001B9D8C21|nr:hypothetical protein [Burkholderia vietnamiensis]MBR8279086.1 hypothetical protein [Burkholderia vietnamiensis]
MTKIVLDWRNRAEWLDATSKYAGHVLTPALRRTLAKTRPKCWSDDMSWLSDWEDLVPEFAFCLAKQYTHLKAFHGCRPVTLSSYYKHGLRGQDGDQLISFFREIFADVPASDLDAAIASLDDRSTRERGAIWLVSDDREMIEEYGHYVIQGSEFLMALAATLGVSRSGEDYRFRLRERGVPTVLEIDLPVGFVNGDDIEEVAKLVLSVWGQAATKQRAGSSPSPCYVVRRTIGAECIVGHVHPAKIRDPHRSNICYVNTQHTCDVCEGQSLGAADGVHRRIAVCPNLEDPKSGD